MNSISDAGNENDSVAVGQKQEDWKHCFHMKASVRRLGLYGMVFTLFVTLLCLIVWVGQPGGGPNMALVTAAWFSFSLGYGYLLLIHYKFRLCVSENAIRKTDLMLDHQVRLAEIRELVWPRYPRSFPVRLRGGEFDLKIALEYLEREDSQQLVACLRQSIAVSKQVGWDRFNEQFEETPEKQVLSARVYLLLSLFFAANSIAFCVVGILVGGLQYFVLCPINAAMAVFLFGTYRKKARQSATKSSEAKVLQTLD